MIFYNMMTFNAAAMIDMADLSQKVDAKDMEWVFVYDFHEATKKDLILEKTDRHADNALFYQVIASKYGDDEERGQCRKNQDCIIRDLLFVNFKVALSFYENRYNASEDEKEVLDKRCRTLFNSGFTVIYEDGETRTYFPLDRSASMSKEFTIAFIDEKLFVDVDRRIRMDMNFDDVKVVLSKYYAYRGLCLTDGVRIPENDNFVLDQNTVLILDDDHHQSGVEFVVTAEKKVLKETKQFKVINREHQIDINGFDGEGLISPEYSKILNETARNEIHMQKDAVSFQIRMPFSKGMLHCVDFRRFFAKEFDDENVYIKDVFGIYRNLKDVRIILTKSMFKCTGWLQELQETNPEFEKDPMECYFSAFHKYDHALYVCGTDANMGNYKVLFSYQFLNTLDISGSDLEKLVKRHINEVHSIPETGMKYAIDSSEYLVKDDETFVSVPAWRYALSMNKDFVHEPYVKRTLKMDEFSRIKDICKGRISVDGRLKYLSGDLLSFLIHMINKSRINEEKRSSTVAGLKKKLMMSDNFYVPDHADLGLSGKERYSIWRNPHLSRSEQCAPIAFVPDEEDNIYDKYFGHLKNIIMLPYDCLNALVMGGADFDGDKVKLVLNSTINKAVLKGAYIKNDKQYVRRYPIVEIPALNNKVETVPEKLPYELARDTFSNKIGHISNQAIRIGKKGYLSDKNEDGIVKTEDDCAKCTLAAGLEIDSVKTGVSPDFSDLLEKFHKKDYYLNVIDILDKNKYSDMNTLKVFKGKEDGKHGGTKYYLKQALHHKEKKMHYKSLFDAELIPSDAEIPAIDRLPGYLLDDLYARKKTASSKAKQDPVLFKFQSDPNWVNHLKNEDGATEKQKKLANLIKAYRKITAYAKEMNKRRKRANESVYIRKIWTNLMKNFDFKTENLPDSGMDIPSAIETAFTEITELFHSYDDVLKAIERMKDHDWIFVGKQNRKEVLNEILNIEDDVLSAASKEILLTDAEDGFDLLKLYLFAVRDELSARQTGLLDAGNTLKKYSEEDYEQFFEEYSKGQNNKEAKKVWNARIVDACRARLETPEMFNGDYDKALRYYYACRRNDPDREFLWDVFRTNEILRNVHSM